MVEDLKELLSDPRHPGWGNPPLPEWVTVFRPAQRDAVEASVAAFDAGVSQVVLSAPTGSGKTLVGELVRRALGLSAAYVCVDKGLQDQVVRDFPYARVLKGRANYSTLQGPYGTTADDCRGGGCPYCEPEGLCPYRVAKREARDARLAVLNTAYLLAEANGQQATFTGLNLVVADEADRLESAVMSHVGVAVGQRRLQAWGVAPLESGAAWGDAEAWVRDEIVPAIQRSVARCLDEDPELETLRVAREVRTLQRLREGLDRVLAELSGKGWVVCAAGGAVEFKPVRVRVYAPQVLWRHSSRWFLMSATVLSAQKMFADLGILDPWSWVEVDMPSSFPPANRLVHMLNASDVTRKNLQAADEIADALSGVLARHPDDRVFVHTVSFRLQRELRERLGRGRRNYVWYETGQRDAALQRYLREPASVLFAPGMERGVDFPDDDCRAIIVCKVPYPDMGDAQVAARLVADPEWYGLQALRSLVQMTGRGVRHERDRCETYVLDRQADRLLARYRGAVPRWWGEAVVREGFAA